MIFWIIIIIMIIILLTYWTLPVHQELCETFFTESSQQPHRVHVIITTVNNDNKTEAEGVNILSTVTGII